MKNLSLDEPPDNYCYEINFRYKKFNTDLRATDFIKSKLIIKLKEAVPEPMHRNWASIVQELNPNYFQIEIINIAPIENED